MEVEGRAPITQVEFVRIAQLEHCGTMSFARRPTSGEIAWRGTSTIANFLSQDVFPVWLLGPNGGDFDHHDHPDYHRILFRDALEREDFRKECLRERHSCASRPPLPSIMVLHCTTCGHAAVIDGNHRLARLALTGGLQTDTRIAVIGLSGTEWASDVPDMNKVCRCLAP